VARDVPLGSSSLYAASVPVVVVPWRNQGSTEARVTYRAVGTRAGVPMMYAWGIRA
jgi:hypothetical protein